MLGQSKNAFQAEIDTVCELMTSVLMFTFAEIYKPVSSLRHAQPQWRERCWKLICASAANTYSIHRKDSGGNLPYEWQCAAMLLFGSWFNTQIYSTNDWRKEAGLLDGVTFNYLSIGPPLDVCTVILILLVGCILTGSQVV